MPVFGNAPLLKLSILLSFGVVFQIQSRPYLTFPFFFIISLGLIWCTSFFLQKKRKLSLTTSIGLIILGYSLSLIQNESQVRTLPSSQTYSYWLGEVSDITEKKDRWAITTKMTSVYPNDQNRKNKYPNIALSIKKHKTIFNIGDLLLIKQKPTPIAPPRNPKDFDYQHYMNAKGIFFQQYINEGELLVISKGSVFSPINVALSIKRKAAELLKKAKLNKDNEAILAALLLGDKTNISSEIKKSFASAGVMHVLAVSGLHVGFFYLAIHWIFGLLGKTKKAILIKSCLAIIIIWSYVLITGLHASTTRAAIMFSLIALGESLNKKSAAQNSVGLSILILVIANPAIVLDVGFQLSHLAVIGIIYLQPHLSSLVKSKYWIINTLWQWTAVSIAAQIVTFPLIIYYFGSFPLLFIPANLIIIPLVYIAFFSGILMLVLGSSLTWLSTLVDTTINIIKLALQTITSTDFALIKGIETSLFDTTVLYLMIILAYTFFRYKKPKYIYWLSSFTLILSISMTHNEWGKFRKKEIIFYSVNNEFKASYYHNGIEDIWRDQQLDLNQPLHPDNEKSKLQYPGLEIKVWNALKIMRLKHINQENQSLLKKEKVDVLILADNIGSKIDLETLPKFKHLVLDNTNKKWVVDAVLDKIPDGRSLRKKAFVIK